MWIKKSWSHTLDRSHTCSVYIVGGVEIVKLNNKVLLKYFGTQSEIFWCTILNILVCNLIYFGIWSDWNIFW